ncbi:MAG: hypothetical protein NVS9B9_04840 [Ktedonobacteraceae bacterium]
MGTPNTNKGTGALPHATTAHSNGNIVPTDITTSLVGSSDEQDEPGLCGELGKHMPRPCLSLAC